jgi:hypothetical protein
MPLTRGGSIDCFAELPRKVSRIELIRKAKAKRTSRETQADFSSFGKIPSKWLPQTMSAILATTSDIRSLRFRATNIVAVALKTIRKYDAAPPPVDAHTKTKKLKTPSAIRPVFWYHKLIS